MSSSKENFLKALVSLSIDGEFIANKTIAQRLKISPASVSEMVAKLQKIDYVDYEPYAGCRLTTLGKREALHVLRYHRLWEVFLSEHLHFSNEFAHMEAEHLEHATSPELARALDEYLGYPKYCPHGSGIPNEDGELPLRPLLKLSEIQQGKKGIIVSSEDDIDLNNYLTRINLHKGMKFLVAEVEKFDGSVTLRTDLRDYQLSYKTTTLIYVRELP